MKSKCSWLSVILCGALVISCGKTDTSDSDPPGSPASGSAPKPAAGNKERVFEIAPVAPVVKMAFVWCPPGTFQMGSPDAAGGASPVLAEMRGDDELQHEVTLTEGFWIGKYEVTQAQWVAVMGENPSNNPRGRDFPVNNVSWYDAHAFLGKLGGGYRLPTEAEWEYACRAGEADFDITVTPDEAAFGDRNEPSAGYNQAFARYLGERAWYIANSGSRPHPVGQKQANAWGIHDMQGNLWEWCQDWHAEGYYADGQRDPAGPADGFYRVSRGGSFYGIASDCRSATRNKGYPEDRILNLGFRVAVSSTRPVRPWEGR